MQNTLALSNFPLMTKVMFLRGNKAAVDPLDVIKIVTDIKELRKFILERCIILIIKLCLNFLIATAIVIYNV
jgi:hypothetical protein